MFFSELVSDSGWKVGELRTNKYFEVFADLLARESLVFVVVSLVEKMTRLVHGQIGVARYGPLYHLHSLEKTISVFVELLFESFLKVNGAFVIHMKVETILPLQKEARILQFTKRKCHTSRLT